MKSQRSLYPYCMALFCVVLVLSNTIAARLIVLGPFVLAGAVVLFPVSYILGDVLTEVYGYAGARRIFWAGLAANLLMVAVFALTDRLPAVNPDFAAQFHVVLAQVPRIVIASLCGIWCGQFANAFVLSQVKKLTRGRFLFLRTIGSTICGESIDTLVFSVIGFAGILPLPVIVTLVWSGALLKTLYETLATPLTYLIVAWFKRHEGLDTYDYDVSYTPFSLAAGELH